MKLNLTTEQVNQILNALAQQPYIQVHELIANIQQQGQAQLQVNNSEPAASSELAQEAMETVTNGNG
jgi:hypothetical protein